MAGSSRSSDFKMTSKGDISNESFLNAYDKLGISKINQSNNTKKVSWDQMIQIFSELKVPLCAAPRDKVSK